MEGSDDRTWQGSPLDLGDDMDPYGIREIVIEFDNGDSDTFRARLREEFRSYELHQAATYIETIAGSVRKGERR